MLGIPRIKSHLQPLPWHFYVTPFSFNSLLRGVPRRAVAMKGVGPGQGQAQRPPRRSEQLRTLCFLSFVRFPASVQRYSQTNVLRSPD